MSITLKTLQEADSYQPGHKVRVIRDLFDNFHLNSVESLLNSLDKAWDAGYTAKTEEDAENLRTPTVPKSAITEADAKAILMTAGGDDTIWLRRLASKPWIWDADQFGWGAGPDEDCLIRPGDNGIILMEAGGEYAGTVYTRKGEVIRFGENTFR